MIVMGNINTNPTPAGCWTLDTFISIISFSLKKNLLFYRWGIWGPERLSNEPQVTQQEGAWRWDLNQVQLTPETVAQPSHSLSWCVLGARTVPGPRAGVTKRRAKSQLPWILCSGWEQEIDNESIMSTLWFCNHPWLFLTAVASRKQMSSWHRRALFSGIHSNSPGWGEGAVWVEPESQNHIYLTNGAPNNPVREVLSSLLYRCSHWSPERLSKLPKVTQLVMVAVVIWTQAAWLQV